MMNHQTVLILLFFVCCFIMYLPELSAVEDRLQAFYKRIAQSDATYCSDKTFLLPECKICIPGLQKGKGSSTCNEYVPSSKQIRDEIRKLVIERFGANGNPDRLFGLYPYLEKEEFLQRHYTFAKLLQNHTISTHQPIHTLMDIGAYYNPIHLFLSSDICPKNIIVIEPILDALSVSIPCTQPTPTTTHTHILFLPITFKFYANQMKNFLPMPETVICIGCDSHYGPNRKHLETSFSRPYTLYLEYPSEYIHNMPYKRMVGKGEGESLLYQEKMEMHTNETIYTKRMMKVIHYQPATTSLP